MNRSTRRLIHAGSSAVAVIALGLAVPSAAHAMVPPPEPAGAVATTVAKSPTTCTSRRPPVAIAPRLVDKDPTRPIHRRHCN